MPSFKDIWKAISNPMSQENLDAYVAMVEREGEGQKAIDAVREQYDKAIARGESPQKFMNDIDQVRGAAAGSSYGDGPQELAEALPSAQQRGVADRYAWGADIASQNPIVGPLALIPAAGYDFAKLAAPWALDAADAVIPHHEGYDLSTMDETTSEPSMAHLQALWRGYLAGRR